MGSAAGSSPRVWGTLRLSLNCTGLGRFIPACVGNSIPCFPINTGISVHPRVCGELADSAPVHPRVCGELRDNLSLMFSLDTVHPRVCGELGRAGQRLGYRFIPACVGNSRIGDSAECFRFIPACVGNSTAVSTIIPDPDGSSPRVWGTLPLASASWMILGSSPRVWGTLGLRGQRVVYIRFIPACVGNSPPGETEPFNVAGSSPRVWGTQDIVGIPRV